MTRTFRRVRGFLVALTACSQLLANRPAADPFGSDEAAGTRIQSRETRFILLSDSVRCRWPALRSWPAPDNRGVFRCPFP